MYLIESYLSYCNTYSCLAVFCIREYYSVTKSPLSLETSQSLNFSASPLAVKNRPYVWVTANKRLTQRCAHFFFWLFQDKDPTLGYLGPTLRAKVGDTIKINFKNNARWTTSLHPHGVLYAKSSEGSPYNDGTAGAHSQTSLCQIFRHSSCLIAPLFEV